MPKHDKHGRKADGQLRNKLLIAPKSTLWPMRTAFFVFVSLFSMFLLALLPGGKAFAQEWSLGVQTGHQGSLGAVALSRNGQTLLTAGQDGFAQAWEVSSGRALRRWLAGTLKETLSDQTDRHATAAREFTPLQSAAISGDGQLCVTADELGWLDLRETATGKSRRRWKAEGNVLGLSLSPDGTALSVASEDSLCVWDTSGLDTGGLNSRWRIAADSQNPFTAFAASEDGIYLSVGDQRGGLHVFLAQQGREIWSGRNNLRPASGLAFCGAKNLLLVACGVPKVALWDVVKDEMAGELSFPMAAETMAGNSGTVVSAFDEDGHLMFASLQTNRTWFLKTTGNVTCAALVPGAATFMAGRIDGGAELCDIYRGSAQRRFVGLTDAHTAFRWFSRNVLAVRGVPSNDLPPGAETSQILDGIYAPSGKRFVGRTQEGNWRLWRAESSIWTPLNAPISAQKGKLNDQNETRGDLGQENYDASFSADSAHVLVVTGNTAMVFQTATGEFQMTLSGPTDDLRHAILSPDGHLVGAITSEDEVGIWQTKDGHLLRTLPARATAWTALAFADSAGSLLSGTRDGTVTLWKANGKKARQWTTSSAICNVVCAAGAAIAVTEEGEIWRWPLNIDFMEGDFPEDTPLAGNLQNEINSAAIVEEDDLQPPSRVLAHVGGAVGLTVLPDGRHLLSCGNDGELRFFEAATLAPRGSVFGLRDGGWLALETDNKYDSSDGASPAGLHFVRGLSTLSLTRDVGKAFEARWLATRLGIGAQPLLLSPTPKNAAPRLALKPPQGTDTTFHIEITNQGGGIGPVAVWLNGLEISQDARGARFDPDVPSAGLDVELSGLRPGRRNWVRVLAQTSPAASAPVEALSSWDDPGVRIPHTPRFYGLFAGVSTTQADPVKVPPLRFAAADAQALSQALWPAAKRLFGPKNVEFHVLSSELLDLKTEETDNTLSVALASKDQLDSTLQNLARDAYEEDTVLIFLAGHGVTYDPKGKTYAFLTSDAGSGDLADSPHRTQWALTGEEMGSWMNRITAGRVAMILDTCAAGASTNLEQTSQTAAFDLSMPRDSYFVLAGTAATASSYEIPALQHGILTYALLQGLRGEALGAPIKNQDADSKNTELHNLDLSKWLEFASARGAEVAARFNAPQKPIFRALVAGTALLGQFAAKDFEEILLPLERPFLLPPLFARDSARHDDPLDLESSVAALLSTRSDAPDAPFTYSPQSLSSSSVEPRGIYTEQGDQIIVKLRFYRSKIAGAATTIKASREKIAAALALSIEEEMTKG